MPASRLLLLLQAIPFALLLADSLYTAGQTALTPPQIALAGAAGIWLAASAALLFRRSPPNWTTGAALAVLALLLGAGLIESILRFGPPLFHRKGSYWTPGTRYLYSSDPAIFPGVSGLAVFSVNEEGLRGPSIQPMANRTKVLKIITVGGSTTECPHLDDSETWPQLLMDKLNQGQSARYVHVGNGGISGHTSVEHLYLLEHLPAFESAGAIVFLIGINDLLAAVAYEGASTEKPLGERAVRLLGPTRLPRAFQVEVPAGHLPRYGRSLVFQFLYGFRRMGETPTVRDGSWVQGMRERRAGHPRVRLPALEVNLAEYRARVARLATLCRQRSKRCVFLTQPTLWKHDQPADEEALFWLGEMGAGGASRGYVSSAGMAEGMRRFNDVLRDACRQDGLECYDLATAIAPAKANYYDECHYSEEGSRRVAAFVAARLLEAGLTSPQAKPETDRPAPRLPNTK